MGKYTSKENPKSFALTSYKENFEISKGYENV